ncbi:DUF2147 domain-containing protein [Aquimarina litoralis]|uniref:DUF2147 domain-containing protein n=1 Tax=Aquimarina litoralis TaxID=584605 RepID=UPI001C55A048|nr:DUF2147 domain-containing protein [Aquimarina litoralis]MBW1296496.1 DUF2147 domain-containing protein [Aquimarina litoralis]
MRFLFFLFIIYLFTQPVTPETYIGTWQIEGGSIIEIYKEGDVFAGKINKRAENPISNFNGLDNKNPDPALRNRSLLGMDILTNLKYEKGELTGGTIYNADSGKTYDVKVWIESENKNTCFIRAYKGILFKTFKATRTKN